MSESEHDCVYSEDKKLNWMSQWNLQEFTSARSLQCSSFFLFFFNSSTDMVLCSVFRLRKATFAFGNKQVFISKAGGHLTAKLIAKSSVNPRKHQVSIWSLVPVCLQTPRWTIFFFAFLCFMSQSTSNSKQV